MDIVITISVIAAVLLAAELLLPTGGLLAIVGAAGFITAGIIALGEDSSDADYAGPGLITLGVVSLVSAVVIGRKVVDAQMSKPSASMVGREGEVRTPLEPEGQIFIGGALWRARPADGAGAVPVGGRVRVQAIEGLTLVVEPVAPVEN